MFIGKKRRQWALFSHSIVWSGFSLPHEDIDVLYRQVIPFDLILVSAKHMDKEEATESIQKYRNFVDAKGFTDSPSSAEKRGDDAIQTLVVC
jgi:hypothetical protein